MPLRPNMEPGEYLEILRRRKWLIVFSFLVIFFAALVYCVVIPDQYKSSAKILIIPPSVAEGMIRSTVNLSVSDRLRAIEQDTLSRARLSGVISGIGISRLGFAGMSEEDMLQKMRSRIDLEIDRKGGRDTEENVNTFVLSFLHEDPKVAKDVASSLSTLFIGGNIRLREAVTVETSKFLDTQLEETRVRLEKQEEKIKRYKLQYGGELPQQEQANMNRLQRLQDQIKNNTDSIARLQDRKVFMESQIRVYERNARLGDDQSPWDAVGSGNQETPARLLSELAMQKKKLEEVSRKYTALHPAVVQTRWEVERLEAKIAILRQEARKSRSVSRGGTAGSSSTESDPDSPQGDLDTAEVKSLRAQIAQGNLEINALKRENQNASRTMDDIQRKVERLPQREQEMVGLMRDYENLKKSYDELLDKKLKANVSRNLEETQKAERFQVLEPPNLPSRASKPDRLKALGIALAVFLAIAVGGSFGLEMVDPKLRGSKEFKSFFDLPILASLPVIQNDEYRHRIAFRSAAIKGGLASILGAYVVFFFLHGAKVRSIVQSIVVSTGGKN